MEKVPLYDVFSADYDRFVDWQSRLTYELPFIEEQLAAVGARRLLDAACGTGAHAIALARRGYSAVGTDLSAGMIERARQNASAVNSTARFVVAGFGQLAEQVGGPFDALLCLGNSLSHALSTEELERTLCDFAAMLRPGGLLLVQNRNFDQVLAQRQRWIEPQSHREDEADWLFVRFYDWGPDGDLTFNVLTLKRDAPDQPWRQQATATRLQPWRRAELVEVLQAAGFTQIIAWGDMQGTPFDSQTSGNLILTARTIDW